MIRKISANRTEKAKLVIGKKITIASNGKPSRKLGTPIVSGTFESALEWSLLFSNYSCGFFMFFIRIFARFSACGKAARANDGGLVPRAPSLLFLIYASAATPEELVRHRTLPQGRLGKVIDHAVKRWEAQP